jgi:hypothetical protein
MAIFVGVQWRDPVERRSAAVEAAHAWQAKERAAAFERIEGLAEQWPDWTPDPEAVTR